ncbi:MAG: Gfo/Idh/MocA family oxidoreductase [Actinomycetota bacterium]|nr:Gfo/Idh/MocA family oxidoreductase [Actinomycetota bacterium]
MTVRYGLIGAGWVGTARHVPSVARADGAELVAVYDRRIERARAAAGDRAQATDDLAAFYDLGVDAVSICTSPWGHAELTIDALDRGVDVLCEKPMAITVAEAHEMVRVAEHRERVLCIAHNFLWSNAMVRARRALADAGSLHYVAGVQLSSEARRLPTWYRDLDGGLLTDEIPHMLYLLDDLLGHGLTVENVRAEWNGRTDEPQSCEVWLRGAEGPGQISMVFGAPVSEWHVTTVAERNVVDVDLFRDVVVTTGSDGAHLAKDVLGTSLKMAGRHLGGFAAAGVRLARGRQLWGHDGLVQAFVDAVATRGPSPVPPSAAVAVMTAATEIVAGLRS